MSEHVNQWIGAYLDGELSRNRCLLLEAHLAICPTCRQELESTRQLSSWLGSLPLPESLPTAGEFAGKLNERLPERPPERTTPSPSWTAPGLIWWMIPLAILSGWLAAQIVILLPEWSWALLPLGISNAALAWLSPGSFLSLWIGLVSGGLPGEPSLIIPLSLVEFASLWQGALLQIGLNALAALLFMSWLAGLAARRIHQAQFAVPAS